MKNKRKKLALLTQVVRVRGISMKEVRESLRVSIPTASKFLAEPKYMNGIHRAALAKLLKLNGDTVDAICSGTLKTIGEITEI